MVPRSDSYSAADADSHIYPLCNLDAEAVRDALANPDIFPDFDGHPIPDAIEHAFVNAEPQCYGDAYLDPYPKRDT